MAAITGGFEVAQPWRWLVIPVCFAGVALAERYPVKIGPEQKVNLGALPCLVAALLLPAGVGPATAGLSVLVANVLMRRTWPESVYNAGNTLIGASIVALIGRIGPDTDLAQDFRATGAVFLYLVVNLGLGVLPAALRSGHSYVAFLRQAASATWPASLTLGACAMSIALLSVEAPVAAALPLVVLPMIYRMNRAIEAQSKANVQIAGVLAAQRRFLTDVSHQVATPLATIMTNLSILSRAARKGPAGEAVAEAGVALPGVVDGYLGRGLLLLAQPDLTASWETMMSLGGPTKLRKITGREFPVWVDLPAHHPALLASPVLARVERLLAENGAAT